MLDTMDTSLVRNELIATVKSLITGKPAAREGAVEGPGFRVMDSGMPIEVTFAGKPFVTTWFNALIRLGRGEVRAAVILKVPKGIKHSPICCLGNAGLEHEKKEVCDLGTQALG